MPKGRQSRQLRAEMRLCIGDSTRPASLRATISYFVHRAILPELPSEIKTSPPEYTKQTTCKGHGHLLAALLVCGSTKIKIATFSAEKGNPRLAWQCACYEFWEKPKISGSTE